MQRLDGDEGAVAVIVAVALVVFLGMAALIVDVGNLYWERRQLQNGADAAAMAAAQDFVNGNGGAAYETARQYADANNSRGAFVANGDPGFVVGANSVTVTAQTGSYAAAGELTSILASVLGIDEYATSASATASWGTIGSGTTIPIGFCEHAWHHLTGPDNSSGPPAHILRIGVPPGHLQADVDCSNPGVGDPPPGGFGFLDADGNCLASIDAGGWMQGSNGNNPDLNGPCNATTFYAMLYNAVQSGSTVLIPIFDEYQNQGVHGRYHIIGFGGFLLEGYTVNGGPQHPVYGRSHNWSGSCPGSATCLRGYFTEFFDIGGVPSGGGPDYGAFVIGLTG